MLLSSEINLFPDQTVFVQLLIFLSVLAALNILVFKPLLKVLQLRRSKTEGDLKRIGEVQAKAMTVMKEYEGKIKEARLEAFRMKEEIRREGESEATRIIQEARQAGLAQVEKIKREIEDSCKMAEKDLELQSEILSRSIAEKVLGRSLQN